MHRRLDHYSGVQLHNTTNKQSYVVPLLKPNLLTYNSSELRKLNNEAIKVKRKIRKKLFALQIWRPHTTPSNGCTIRPPPVNNHRCPPDSKWQLPSVAVINARSIKMKIDELSIILEENHTDVASVCETWLEDSIDDQLVNISGYQLLRNDRIGKKGGGVMMYIKQTIPVKQWPALQDSKIESLWVTITPPRLPRSVSCISLAVIYYPPTGDHIKLQGHILHAIDHIRSFHPQTGIIITGDFNQFPDKLIEPLCNIRQVVKAPTRGKNILDKIFSNFHQLYVNPVLLPPLGSSDHNMLIYLPNPSVPEERGKTKSVKTRVMGPNERAMFAQDLRSINWFPLYCLSTYQDQHNYFYHTLNLLTSKHFPIKHVRRHSNEKPWVTDSFRFTIRRRQRAFLQHNMQDYCKYRNRANRMVKQYRSVYYTDHIEKLKWSNKCKWWSEVKQLTEGALSRNQLPLQQMADVNCDGNIRKLAEEMNSFFQSLCDTMPPLQPPKTQPLSQVPDKFTITRESVEYQLNSLNIKKAPGPDNLPTWILKDFSSELAGPVAALYNSSIRERTIHQQWKSAYISPIPKKQPAEDIKKDIRPISLTPQLSKGLEFYIVKWLWDDLAGKIDPCQFGCVKKSSTVHALVQLMHECFNSTDGARAFVRVLLLDYTKAFDRINHQLLIDKLKDYKVSPIIIDWIASFLSDRKQQVRLGSIISSQSTPKGGVPQGTLLGPVLFLVMINDLNVPCQSLKYVDDTTLVCEGNDPTSTELQQAANAVLAWSLKNDMLLNPSKTKELRINFSKKMNNFSSITMESTVIEAVTRAKILGITVSNDLKWNDHISKILKRTSQRLFMLSQCKRCGMHPSDIIIIYKTKVRPIIEYCCQAWFPGLPKYLKEDLERLQKRALKIIHPDMSYHAALTTACLDTLNDRLTQHCRSFFQAMQNPSHKLHHLLPPTRKIIHGLRNPNPFALKKTKTKRTDCCLVNWAIKHFMDK